MKKLNFTKFNYSKGRKEAFISISKKGRVSLSKVASENLDDLSYVDILIDVEEKALKLKKGYRYKITEAKRNKVFNCPGIPLPAGRYYAEDDYYIFKD